jgi:hypothetical protein
MFCLPLRLIHTSFLSNQDCGVDKTNGKHPEKEWTYSVLAGRRIVKLRWGPLVLEYSA